ncbi:MAG: hypothetical protein LQ337_008518 [Flavoplaca oasis]|nr:MAG: hypothetical protein LQ337_008518 [Flavoplaca oasis]
MRDPFQSSRSHSAKYQPLHGPIPKHETPLKVAHFITTNDVFTETVDADHTAYHTPNHRSFPGRPEALHEIGLTLSEVDDVLRRRASLSLRLNDPPTPCPRRKVQKTAFPFLMNKNGSLSLLNVTTPFQSPVKSAPSLTLATAIRFSPTFEDSGGAQGGIASGYHQRGCSFPINIISPSPISPSSSPIDFKTSIDYSSPTTPSSAGTCAISLFPASSPDTVEILTPLRSMALTIKRLEDQIAELEERLCSLEDEVEHWKAEAEKMTVEGNENAGWFMF